MNDKADKEFAELALKTIAPWAESWPDDLLHFQLMKAAVMEDRETVRKALTAMVKADGDPNLSLKGKEEQRRKIEIEAIAKLDASSKRAKARESYDAVMAKWGNMVASILKPAKDHNEAVMHAQIRDRLFNLKDQRERMLWLERNVGDPVAASALLTAPAFLSGLSDVELALVRSKVEALALTPEIIEAKAATMKAWEQVEAGRRAAHHKINERAGLTNSGSPVREATVKAS
jgi:hypothetical protein